MASFRIQHYKVLDSTNLEAKRLLLPNSVIVADTQAKGRGRYRRSWSSGKGGLYFSIILKRQVSESSSLSLFTLIAALAVRSGIKKIAGISSAIKWPNDILIGGRKVAGILVESLITGKVAFVIIGIGINANNSLPRELRKRGISIRQVFKKEIDNQMLLASILHSFEKYLRSWKKTDFSPLLEEYRNYCITLGTIVAVKSGGRQFRGRASGINEEGHLLIEGKDGKHEIIDGTLLK